MRRAAAAFTAAAGRGESADVRIRATGTAAAAGVLATEEDLRRLSLPSRARWRAWWGGSGTAPTKALTVRPKCGSRLPTCGTVSESAPRTA